VSLALWRRSFETTLAEEYGWLSLAGLYWFEEGSFSLGTDPASDFVLDADPLLPTKVGTLTFTKGELTFVPEADVAAQLGSKPVTGPTRLNFEDEADPSVLRWEPCG